MAEREKLGGTGGEDPTPTILPKRKRPEGAPPSKDTGASGHPPSASSPTSEDSAVDSDDSIELEIRRFLAEKAKESIRNAEPQGGPAKQEMPCRKEPTLELQPGMCAGSQKARGTPHLAKGRRGPERARTQATSLLSQTGKGTLRAEQAIRLTTALGRSKASLPKNTSRNGSAKALPPSRKSANVHKDHSPQGSQTAVAESVFGQLPSCAKVSVEAGSARGTFHLNYGRQNLLTPNPGSQADLALSWSDFAHQSRLSSPWVLNLGQGTVWTGIFQDEKENGTTPQAGSPPASPQAPGRACLSSPPSSSTSGRTFLGGGGKQAGLFSPNVGSPLQSSVLCFQRDPAWLQPCVWKLTLANEGWCELAKPEGSRDPETAGQEEF